MTERRPETEGPETEVPDTDVPDTDVPETEGPSGQPENPDLNPARTGQEFGEPERTGVEEVDDVLVSLGGLDDRAVEEHPAVFECAHDRLRQALDGPAGT